MRTSTEKFLRDADKPLFHVLPRAGWLNDPNGPIFYKGAFHLFYQHVVGSSKWDWACAWGHATSTDLVHWQHLPVALQPSVEGFDSAGCWSGCAALDEGGHPHILYTGVRLRDGKTTIPLPPPNVDLGQQQIEVQLLASCQEGEVNLKFWHKAQGPPLIPLPPEGLRLAGFRDPFVFQQPGAQGGGWRLLLGSGVEGRGGTLLSYASDSLTEGWRYEGEVPLGASRPCGDWDLGAMWECPFLGILPAFQEAARRPSAADVMHAPGATTAAEWDEPGRTHVLCVSPYPHTPQGRPTNPCLFWLGRLRDARFDMEAAQGPERLDLGDCLYAPTTVRDGAGRLLMLAWLQELRKGGAWDYCGCLSLPRVLTLREGSLHQAPLPELEGLRTAPAWEGAQLDIPQGASVPLPGGVRGPSVDLSLTLHRGASSAGGLVLRAWEYREGGEPGPFSAAGIAALLVDWQAASLEVVFAPAREGAGGPCPDLERVTRRVGGSFGGGSGGAAPASLALRVLIDHSAVEVFTGCGRALATRVYRGRRPASQDPGFFLFGEGGACEATALSAHSMGSIWLDEFDQPRKVAGAAAS